MKISAEKFSEAGDQFLGRSYDEMDCQEFVERCMAACGLKMDLGGSNSWYREIMKHGWVGTPEECVKLFGFIPKGAIIFIWEPVSASTPAQFRNDGIGDITHMGVYTALSGKEMVRIAQEAGVKDAEKYNFGDGAIHSSSSRGGVCTSKFAGHTIPNGGWNRVGLFLEKIAYVGIEPEPGPEPQPTPPEPQTDWAVVVAESGDKVKMRAKPTQACGLYWEVPVGAEVMVYQWNAATDKKGQVWARIAWAGQDGFMIQEFLRDEEETDGDAPVGTETWTVTITGLTYEQAEQLCMDWGNATMKRG